MVSRKRGTSKNEALSVEVELFYINILYQYFENF